MNQIKYVKEFYQLLKAWRISLEANCIGKSVNFLDITLYLQKKSLYIHATPCSPKIILKQFPTSAET